MDQEQATQQTTDIVPAGPSLPPVEFSVTDQALAELKEKYGTVPDVSTKEGYAEAKAAIAVLRETRTGVENHRKDLKADALAWGKKVDAEANRIKDAIIELETPIKEARKAEDDRKEAEKRAKKEAEARKLAEVRDKIARFDRAIAEAHDMETDVIEQLANELEMIPVTEDEFGEATAEAQTAKSRAVSKLYEIIDSKEKAAREEARRVEEERVRKEREAAEAEERARAEAERVRLERIRERINDIRAWPARFIGSKWPDLSIAETKLRESFNGFDFEELADEARQVFEQAHGQMKTMMDDAKAREALEAERAEIEAERARLEAEKEAEAAKERERAEAEARAAQEAEDKARREREAAEAEERRKAEEGANEALQASMHAEAVEALARFALSPDACSNLVDQIKAGNIPHIKWEA